MWFWFGILSGLFSAFSVILNKKALRNVSAALVSWTLFTLPIPLMFIIVMRQGLPKINTVFFICALASSIIFAVTKTVSLHSIKNNFLSKIFPLTAFSIFFSYVFALIFLDEKISFLPLLGLSLIIIGAYIFNVDRAKENIWLPFKLLVTHKESFIFILAMGFTSITGVLDKVAIINTVPNNTFFVLFVENIMLSVFMTFYLLKKEKNWIRDFRNYFWVLTTGSIIYFGVSFFFLQGIVTGAVALVSGIKKFEILFVLILTHILFGDKTARHAWIGAVIMILGAILTKLG